MKKRILRSLPLVALLSLAPVAFGQTDENDARDNDHADHLNLDEIVVTGSPLARSIGQSITAVTALDGEELADRLAATARSRAKVQPLPVSS